MWFLLIPFILMAGVGAHVWLSARRQRRINAEFDRARAEIDARQRERWAGGALRPVVFHGVDVTPVSTKPPAAATFIRKTRPTLIAVPPRPYREDDNSLTPTVVSGLGAALAEAMLDSACDEPTQVFDGDGGAGGGWDGPDDAG